MAKKDGQKKLLLDVLLVEDDPNDALLFTKAVKACDANIGFRIVRSVDQAICYLEGEGTYRDRGSHPFPDLVVLDLVMPGKSGYDFLNWRKGRAAFARLPVLILSAVEDPRAAKRAFGLGAGGYLPKPAYFEGWVEVARQVWDLGIQYCHDHR